MTVPSEPAPAAPARGWAHLVTEQLEEMAWAAGLLKTLGERLLRAPPAEAREAGATLVRHAESLVRLKEGHLAKAHQIVEEAYHRRVGQEEWRFVGKALRASGEAMASAGRSYAGMARHLPTMEGEFQRAPGELLTVQRLVEERGGQLRRLGERLLALSPEQLLALSSTLVTRRKDAR